MLVGHSKKAAQVDVNAVNLNGSTPLDIFFNSAVENGDMELGEVIRRAGGQRANELEFPQSYKSDTDELESGEPKNRSPPKDRDEYFTIWQRLFAMKVALSRRVSDDEDKETGNTLMVVATLIATITFQGALNPPGGFIQQGELEGQVVLESVLGDFLVFDMIALISSLSVILLTIYIVPLWKDLIKVSKLITWISVYFTMWSFLSAIPSIFPSLSNNSWIVNINIIGDVTVQLFALFLLAQSCYFLYKRLSMFLRTRSPRQTLSSSRRTTVIIMSILGGSVLWVPWLSLDVVSYFLPMTIYPTFFASPHGNVTETP